MSTNKSISYLLCNKSIIIIVNLYKIHLFFSTKQKSFPSSHFAIPLTKHTRGETKYFLSSHFSILPIFHSSIQTDPKGVQPNLLIGLPAQVI